VALVTANPCNPVCTTTTITTPSSTTSDSCCPAGANANTDINCTPSCGNGVKEAGEDCDSSSRCDALTCRFIPTAFALTSLELRDPHLYSGCNDATAEVNTLVSDSLSGDTSGGADGGVDGNLDLGFAFVFRPLEQTSASGNTQFVDAECLAPAPPASCSAATGTAGTRFGYDNVGTGTCLGVRANTTGGYTPGITVTTAGAAGCWLGQQQSSLRLNLAGIPLVFDTARMAARWDGSPAGNLVDGLIVGFVSEATAQTILLPEGLGSPPLSTFLTGSGDHTCTDTGFTTDDSDVGPDGTTKGWWLYMNFTAVRVAWTE
jgi:hypothetical protein